MKREHAGVARRPEQNTGPNVFYLGMDPVSLHPGRAAEPNTYLWSDRRTPPPPYPQGSIELAPQARTVLEVAHPILWGWRVDLYLVTKGIAAGAGMLAPFADVLGLTGLALSYLPEVLALAFTALTSALLVSDLKRPMLFFRLMTRPNTKSWLVKGGWVLSGFMGAAFVGLVARFFGADQVADAARWALLPLGGATAGYTAWLFAQCEGRDLWQNKNVLLPHLLAQALLLGALGFLVSAPSPALRGLAAVAFLAHLVGIAAEIFGRHHTDNAKQAAALLRVVAAWPGARLPAAGLGVLLGAAGLLLLLVPMLAIAAAPVFILSIFLWERAYIRAGQLPPLS
jgi:hypothetical protein